MTINSSESKKEVAISNNKLSNFQKDHIIKSIYQALCFDSEAKKYTITLAQVEIPQDINTHFNKCALKLLIQNFKYLCDNNESHLIYMDKISIMISSSIYRFIRLFETLEFIKDGFENVTKLEIREFMFSWINDYVEKNVKTMNVTLRKADWNYEDLRNKLASRYPDNQDSAQKINEFDSKVIPLEYSDKIIFKFEDSETQSDMKNLLYLLAMGFTYDEIISNKSKIITIRDSIKNIFLYFKQELVNKEIISSWLSEDHIYLGELFKNLTIYNMQMVSSFLNSHLLNLSINEESKEKLKKIYTQIHQFTDLFNCRVIKSIEELNKNIDFWVFIAESDNAKTLYILTAKAGLELTYSILNYKDDCYRKLFKYHKYLDLLSSLPKGVLLTAEVITSGKYKRYIDLFEKFDFSEHYEKFSNMLCVKNGLDWMMNNKDKITDISTPEGRIFNFISAIVPRYLNIDIYNKTHYMLLEILGNFKISDSKRFYEFLLNIDMQKIMSLNDPKHLEEYIKYPQSNNAFLAVNSKSVIRDTFYKTLS